MESDTEIGKKYSRLVIKNAILVTGRGTPAEGPMDIVIEGNKIVDVIRVDAIALSRQPAGWQRPSGDREIDATGMYVIPGLVDMHVHVPFDPHRAGPGMWSYMYRLMLGHGVTTVRTCGFGNEDQLIKQREVADSPGTAPIPRLVVLHGLPRSGHYTPQQAREFVRKYNDVGADGIKIIEPIAETFEPICDEAIKLGMKAGTVAHLSLNSEIDAVMASNAGVTCIEHTYGIPEAAIPHVQAFPPDYNEWDELARFRQSAFNWIEAEQYPDRVLEVLDLMIKNGTIWDPTFATYEANRDLGRAQYSLFHQKYTTPQLYEYWQPKPGVHASFHFDWKTSDEIAWKEKFRIWLKYVRIFFERGGKLTAGADAGSLYTLYGVSLIRELELLQEAGLRPLDIVTVATTASTGLLGFPDLAGGVRVGYTADLAVVDGNPLDNFKNLYGTGKEVFLEDRVTKVKKGGVKWTIRNGVVFDAPALLREVEEHVKEQKALLSK